MYVAWDRVRSGGGNGKETDVSDARSTPASALRESFDTRARNCACFFSLGPDVAGAGAQLATLLGVESPADHGEDSEVDGVEDELNILDGRDVDAREGGLLHGWDGGGGGKEGRGRPGNGR